MGSGRPRAQNGWEQVLVDVEVLRCIFAIFYGAAEFSTSVYRISVRRRGLPLAIFVLMALVFAAFRIITAGVISFIGLIAPNIARHLGFLKAKSDHPSCVLGALLFLCHWAVWRSSWHNGLWTWFQQGRQPRWIGAPALIIIARKQMSAQDQLFFSNA